LRKIITDIPEKSEKWFQTLFKQLNIKHKILTTQAKGDLLLAKLIDKAREEEGEAEKDKVFQFVKKHGDKI